VTSSQYGKAGLFRSLHTRGDPIVLTNAWDVASARITEAAGVAAVATTSAGVAWSLGVSDGDRLDRVRAVEAIARIAAAVDVPVTADIESGYAPDASGVGETIRGVLAAGAVGVNIEDGLYRRLATARRSRTGQADHRSTPGRRSRTDPAVHQRPRIDTYLRDVGDPAARLAHTLACASAYLDAGADGIFVPGVTDAAVLIELTTRIAAPMNVMVGSGSPTLGELTALGVARISLGSSLASAAYGLAQRAVREALETGSYSALDGSVSYGELNALLARR
jgi:2-methylisocitrate lyase-like PEP mutase family enzyme